MRRATAATATTWRQAKRRQRLRIKRKHRPDTPHVGCGIVSADICIRRHRSGGHHREPNSASADQSFRRRHGCLLFGCAIARTKSSGCDRLAFMEIATPNNQSDIP
jgi:hypothetical protein